MTSKVLVKLPTVPFVQAKKAPSELVGTLAGRNDGNSNQIRKQQSSVDRAAQLEQNIKFLQEQHHATLVALQQEVELLRQRNRDLQFQLVFSIGTNQGLSNSGSPSSPDESSNGNVTNGTGFAKSNKECPPLRVNVTPLQVELLERDLQDVRASLHEVKAQNEHLSEMIEQQKKKLALASTTLEEKKKKCDKSTSVSDIGIQCEIQGPANAELLARLEDAEVMMRRLRRENSEQKKEISSMKAASNVNSNSNSNRSDRSRGNGKNHRNHHHHHQNQNQNQNRSRGNPSDGEQQQQQQQQVTSQHKFPPLQTQSYWHRGSRGNQSGFSQDADFHPKGARNGQDKRERDIDDDDDDGDGDEEEEEEGNDAEENQHQQQQQQQQQREEIEPGNTVLPQLRNAGSSKSSESSNYQLPFYQSSRNNGGANAGSGGYHRHGNVGNNYHRRDGGNRKYRGQRSSHQRERREYHHHHQQQQQQQQQHHQQQQQALQVWENRRDFNNTAEKSKDPRRDFSESAEASREQQHQETTRRQ